MLDGRSSILPVPAADSPDAGASDELKKVMRAGGRRGRHPRGHHLRVHGHPEGALLSAANLRSSARATEQVLRKLKVEPGPWLLALPAHHVRPAGDSAWHDGRFHPGRDHGVDRGHGL